VERVCDGGNKDGCAWNEYTRFALTEQQEHRLREIDAKLSEFASERAPSRGGVVHAEMPPVISNADEVEDSNLGVASAGTSGADNNFLLRSRLQRSRDAYLSTLDRALQLQRRQTPRDEQPLGVIAEGGFSDDSTAALDETQSRASSGSRRSRAVSSSVLTRPVSVAEIESLVADLKSHTPRNDSGGSESELSDKLSHIALNELLQKVRRDISLAKKEVRLEGSLERSRQRQVVNDRLGPSPEYESLLSSYRELVDLENDAEGETTHYVIPAVVEAPAPYRGREGSTKTSSFRGLDPRLSGPRRSHRDRNIDSSNRPRNDESVVGGGPGEKVPPPPPIPDDGRANSESGRIEEMRARLNGLLLRAEMASENRCGDEQEMLFDSDEGSGLAVETSDS